MSRVIALHHALQRFACYPLLCSSLLAGVILVGRIYLSHTWGYAHMAWNLFLAWIPYLCSLWLVWRVEQRARFSWSLLVPAMLWLIFLPNAPYMVTDIVHIRHIDSFVLWYDVVLVATFAWTGCFLAIVSIHIVRSLITIWLGALGGWICVVVSAGLSGLGIYLGRVLRWNSWDVLLDPRGLIGDIVIHVTNPRQYPGVIGVTCLFAALLMVCYLMFVTAYWSPLPRIYRSTNVPPGRSPLQR